ncbi:MAG: hypothetical protein QOH13_1021 [Thermoleophilaceae bacterium]|jgi:hypothetical protein|nr:hypothetical protein [Thermoleophilaceae bacterium]
MGRTFVMFLALTAIGGLAFLTFAGIAENGLSALAVVSIVLLLVLGFGVIGAMTHPPDE